MELQTALTVFQKLEAKTREEYVEADEGRVTFVVPVYTVRLDAGTDVDDERTLRLRVTVNAFDNQSDTREELLAVNLLAQKHDLVMRIDNNGVELT